MFEMFFLLTQRGGECCRVCCTSGASCLLKWPHHICQAVSRNSPELECAATGRSQLGVSSMHQASPDCPFTDNLACTYRALAQVRAFAGWPKAHHTFLLRTPGKADLELPLQVLRTAVCQGFEEDTGAAPNMVHVRDGRVVVGCSGGSFLELLQVGRGSSTCVRACCCVWACLRADHHLDRSCTCDAAG